MNTYLQDIINSKVIETAESRLTVTLHPYRSRLGVTLNDRMFNTEKFSIVRSQEAEGVEKKLLDMLTTYVVGVKEAKASKNVLDIELSAGIRLREVVPQILVAVFEWGASTDEAYKPVVYLEDNRWKVPPVEDHTLMVNITPGQKFAPGEANIGVEYKVWTAD